MGYRWVISPIVQVRGASLPLVATLPDPGRPPGRDDAGNDVWKTIPHSSMHREGVNWMLSFIAVVDDRAIQAATQVIDLLGEDYLDHPRRLWALPRELGWSQERLLTLAERLAARNLRADDIDDSTPLWLPVARVRLRLGASLTDADPRRVQAPIARARLGL